MRTSDHSNSEVEEKVTDTIERDTLQSWLEMGKPVLVIDLQPEDAFREWRIPGSVHLDKYAALKTGADDAMDDVELPTDRPIVTVCPKGKTSALAAQQLRARGYDARTLHGGMQAWSQAWNIAEVQLAESSVSIVQVRRTGKGCLSYLVGSRSEAAVIDPSASPEVYQQLAEERGWRIRSVIETHIQADHLSRSRALAEAVAARLYLPKQQRVSYPFSPLSEGDVIRVGGANLAALSTPGHTDESTSYLLDGEALFTGDTLFTAGIGRPDLDTTDVGLRARASDLYRSLAKLSKLPPDTRVFPGHASEPVPFDGSPITATLGEVRARVEYFRYSEEEFVEALTGITRSTPPNFHRIIEMNEAGELPRDTGELEAGANRCSV